MLRNIQHALFLMSLLLLPLAEWRIIGLPINQRPLMIDLDGVMSASIFDLTFLIFSLSMLPAIAQVLRGRRLFSWYLTYWVFGFALIAITWVTLKPTLPFLTPSQVTVIDVRNLMIHLIVAAVVTVYVANVKLSLIVRYSYGFYLVATAVFVVLSVIAFSDSTYFLFHYPFVNPTQISFPFQGQNVAAVFVTLCLLGLLGTAITFESGIALTAGIPILTLAAALTGSRSNMLVITLLAAVFIAIYTLHGNRLATASGMPCRRKNLIFITVGTVGAVAVLAMNIDYQPVNRALSIFNNLNSAVFMGGGEGAPRRDIWSKVLETGPATAGEGVDESNAVQSRLFSMGLVTISEGCKTEGPLINSLVPGTRYFVRLTIRRDASPSATLEVFSDPEHKQLLGWQSAALTTAALPHLYLLVSDSNRIRAFEGELDGYSIDAIGSKRKIETVSADLYENLFNGGATPLLERASSRIIIKAKDKKLRAYVNINNILPASATSVVLTYQFRLSTVSFRLPIDPPVLFFVGFHDTAVSGGDAALMPIHNGVLIQYVREFDELLHPEENSCHAQDDRYLGIGDLTGLTHAEFVKKLNDKIRCGSGQAQEIRDLWKKPVEPSSVYKTNKEGFNSQIVSGKKIEPSSVGKKAPMDRDPTSVASRLNTRGSTHNVYLDWYYYIGPSSLAVFVLFVASLLTAFAVFTWKHRFSIYFNFYLAVLLQLFAIFGLMYAQPYIWIKYFWFVMGIASGLMLTRVNSVKSMPVNSV